MWPYWFLLAPAVLAAALAGSRLQRVSTVPSLSSPGALTGIRWPMGLYLALLVLMVGWRHEVGADWIHYLYPLEQALTLSWTEGMMAGGDPAYGLLTWLSAHLGLGIYGVNLVCALVFAAGLLVFARNSPSPGWCSALRCLTW